VERGLPLVRRTPGISCEAVPACCRDGAGMRRHVRTSHAGLPCNRAAESFVSFIPLFDGMPTGRAKPFAAQVQDLRSGNMSRRRLKHSEMSLARPIR
jgi:hypothetical protein